MTCAANACNFFLWDESPHSFIRHSIEAYTNGNTISGNNFNKDSTPYALRACQSMDEEFISLTRTKTRIAFSLISDSEISIDYSMNSTILPVIKNIKNISWNDITGKWVIPATLEAYKSALKTLPVHTPNLQIEIDPIPQPIVRLLLTKPLRFKESSKSKEQELQEDFLEEDDMIDIELMDRWSRFVESEVYDNLYKFQQEGVKKAIENKGRLLVANEGGVGKIHEALAIAYAYCKEWPVLVTCPSVLLHTWKEEIEKFFGFENDEVCFLPDARADIFKQPQKRKATQPGPKKKKSKSANKRHDDEENNHVDFEPPRVLFYLISHEVATTRRNQIKNAKLKVAICDGAQYMKARGNTHNKAFIELLESHPRLILLSDIASHCLPVDLYTSVKAIRPDLVTTFDKFAKRYCDPKQQVIGWVYNGRSNSEELQHILEKLVWHSPRMPSMAKQLPKCIRETVFISIKSEDSVDTQTSEELSVSEKIPLYLTMYKRTSEAKMEFFKNYFDYTIRSFRSMKIAIVWYHQEVVDSLKEVLNAREIRYANVYNSETALQEANEFNTTSRIVFVDMKLKSLDSSCLSAADLVIFNEIPLKRSKAKEIEKYFKSIHRKNPLIVKYLIAPNTLDDIQWPIPDNTEL